MPTSTVMPIQELYTKLAAPFDETHSRQQAGMTLTYITGEQCITRLNEVLGPDGWSFSVKEQGINAEADAAWVLGRLEVYFPQEAGGRPGTIVREQFGSQQIKRSRSSGTPLDIGFDLKGAATDALKKCAMGVGVGLYLSKKEEPASFQQAAASNGRSDAGAVGSTGPQAQPATGNLSCADCGEPVRDYAYSQNGAKAGQVLKAQTIAQRSLQYHKRVLCSQHYFAAKKAELEGGQQVGAGPGGDEPRRAMEPVDEMPMSEVDPF